MKIVKPSAKLVYITPDAMQLMELAGRTAYKSEDKITLESADKFVEMIIRKGHLTVIEHAIATIKVVCDRGVSHEIVRHRLFSFTQESTRYCNYASGKYDNQITVIEPPELCKVPDGYRNTTDYDEWATAMETCEEVYNVLIARKVSPQIARSVLPNSLKTEIIITGNFRQWKHFLMLRTAPAAHPQMQEVAVMIKEILHAQYPIVF